MKSGRVIGTAGHIDHGKTALVRALTGIDTDRLKEEKERGITIELGFAHLPLSGGEAVGVVDVPGHERFVRMMVAGAVGIDLVVLVVAADEGVMPQTREHLDICGLLGVTRGVVALSKADLVDGELRAVAAAEVAETLRGTFLEGAPIIPTSARTGEGLPRLRQAIEEGLAGTEGKDPEGLLRLPIDRVFSMKGFGTVVTGTLWAGHLRAGDEVTALPAIGQPTHGKVRGIEVHGAPVEVARAGERTAVNLSLSKEELSRGQTLVHAGAIEAGRVIDARLRYLATCRRPLKRRSRALLHVGTAQILADLTLLEGELLEPGRAGLVQIELDTPQVVLPGDRFVLRGFALQRHHGTTLGGGVILRTLGTRERSTPERVSLLSANERAGADERVALEIERAGVVGIGRTALQMRVAQMPRAVDEALGRLSAARRVVRYDRERGAYISARALASLSEVAVAAVESFHAAQPLAHGMPKQELRARVAEDVRLLHVVLEALAGQGRLIVERETVRAPGHAAAHSQAVRGLEPIAERLAALYLEAALAPPRPSEAAATLSVELGDLEPAIELLVRAGTLIRMKELLFHQQPLVELRARLIEYLIAHGQITAQKWKELVGATRKFTIPLAEHFDAEKLTLRVGEVRKLRAGATTR